MAILSRPQFREARNQATTLTLFPGTALPALVVRPLKPSFRQNCFDKSLTNGPAHRIWWRHLNRRLATRSLRPFPRKFLEPNAYQPGGKVKSPIATTRMPFRLVACVFAVMATIILAVASVHAGTITTVASTVPSNGDV